MANQPENLAELEKNYHEQEKEEKGYYKKKN